MHETSQNNLVKLIRKLGIEFYYDDGLALYYTEQGRAGAQFKAKKICDEFADYLDWYYTKNPTAPDRAVSEFMEDFVSKHELLTEDERAWAPQVVKEVELWIGTSVSVASAKHLSYFVTERNLYMKGGYDSIVNWTASTLKEAPGAIRLNHFVKGVKWNNEGQSTVTFENHDGHGAMDVDAVVVTIPLGALHRKLIGFEPALPASIQTGLQQLSYAALGKVFFEFAEVFWSKDNDQVSTAVPNLPSQD